MGHRSASDLPEIDTHPLEVHLEAWPSKLERFLKKRQAFVKLVHGLIIELRLQGQIEHLKVEPPNHARAELWREGHWPSKRLCLAIYPDGTNSTGRWYFQYVSGESRWQPHE
jgi:hypothetical protein